MSYRDTLDAFQLVLKPERKTFQARNDAVFRLDLNDGIAIGNVVNVDYRKKMAFIVQVIDIFPHDYSYDFDDLEQRAVSGDVLIPPFSMNRALFSGYGVAERIGRFKDFPRPTIWNVLFDKPAYNPIIREFVPVTHGEDPVSPSLEVRSGWNMAVARDGQWCEDTAGDALKLRVQPRNIYSPQFLDLFFARALAYRTGTKIPPVPKSWPQPQS